MRSFISGISFVVVASLTAAAPALAMTTGRAHAPAATSASPAALRAPHGPGEFAASVPRPKGKGFTETIYRRFASTRGTSTIATGLCGLPGSSTLNPGCSAAAGIASQALAAPQRVTDDSIETHSGLVGSGHTYLSMSMLQRRAQLGAPKLGPTFGVGAEVLPAAERRVGFSASYYYYPGLTGTTTAPNTAPQSQTYALQTFSAGVHASLGKSKYAEVGVYGDHLIGTQNAADTTHQAIDAGVGIHF